MGALSRAGMLLALMLIGIGIAVTVKTLAQVGVDRFVLGHVVGPGLVAAGVVRIRLQRMLDGGTREGSIREPAGDPIVIEVPRRRGGDDDGAAT